MELKEVKSSFIDRPDLVHYLPVILQSGVDGPAR